jgi:hypothetical protein
LAGRSQTQFLDAEADLFDWDDLTKVILTVLRREKNAAKFLGLGTKDFKEMVTEMVIEWVKKSSKNLNEPVTRDDWDYTLDYVAEFVNDYKNGW